MKLIASLAFLIITCHICENANILVILPLFMKSHSNMFKNLLDELIRRGHEVDVVSHFPLKEHLSGYNDFSIKGTLPMLTNNLTIKTPTTSVFKKIVTLLQYTGQDICEPILSSKTMQALKKSSKLYDLMIIHYLGTNCMIGLGHFFNIPVIAVITSVNLPWVSSFIGLPDNPSYIPNYFTGYTSEMSIMERFLNTIFYIIANISFYMYNSKIDNIARKYLDPTLPNLDDLTRNVSMVFVNSHHSIHQSRPVPPNFVEIAGIHIDENTTISTYFEESLQTETKGVILVSFGSLIMSESFDENKLQVFFQTCKQLPYKILWKGNKNRIPKYIEIPNNIQFETWMPQLGILCHPNLKLFVSHGGLHSILEAVYCGVPVLGVPFFADQALNVKNSVNKGMALEINFEDLNEDKLLSTIKELLSNQKYKENAEKLSKLFRDRPISPLETAVYWTEYIIRHKGAPQLRSVGANLHWYQYYLIDVVIIFVFVCILAAYLLHKLINFIYLHFILTISRYRKFKIH